MNEDFLLRTPLSKRLYHQHAETLPVIDYHNHLNMKELAEGKSYDNLARLWLLGDPYKHRAMRICGIDEAYITGNASDHDKFAKWMSVLPRLVGNPLYDWSILEMKRIFHIELDPGETDAEWLWEQTGKLLSRPEFSSRALLERFHVEYAAPCAAITDDISVFEKISNIAPSLRGDSIIEAAGETAQKLEQTVQTPIHTLQDYYGAIRLRLDAFGRAGCRFSDHSLDDGFLYRREERHAEALFERSRKGQALRPEERQELSSELLRFLSAEYARRGWTMQLHIGAQRFTSSRLREIAGPAGGFAGIGNCCNVRSLTQMLDDFEKSPWGMPEVVLFTLNPADNAVMSTLGGSYSRGGTKGLVQQGPAWWWCDHLYGMREVFESLASFGVLSVFLGMTTDSRSILSFVRHEYFRRAFCGWLGEKAEKGDLDVKEELLIRLVKDVCYFNAKKRIRQQDTKKEGEREHAF